MLTFISYMVLGLAAGSVYSMTAFGTILVYRGSGVVNFAGGALATVGTFVFYNLADQDHVPWPVAMVAGTLVSGLLGAATYLLVMKPMRKTSSLTRTIATLGVFVIVNAALLIAEPSSELNVRSFYPSGAWHVATGLVLGYNQLILLAISVFTAVSLSMFWGRTMFGLRTTAVAENQRSASTLGISPDVVATVNWFLGCALAGLAGVLLVPILGLQIATITTLLFPSLAAALVGRMDRFLPALVGGLAIGIGESLVAGYFPTTPGLTVVVPFAGVLGLMLLRGQGIPSRGYLRDRLPEVGKGRVRPVPFLIALAVLLGVAWGFGPDYANAMIVTAGTAIVLLSVVLVTGYAGQISLCQFALAGIGAFVTGRLVAAFHVPLLLAIVLAVLVALAAGVMVGVPALRSRGVSLAVLTLGFAIVLQELVFDNSSLVGIFGDSIGPLRIFGFDLDASLYPARYATFAIIVFLLLALLVAKIRRGTLGRRLLAVRGSERAAAALGINVYSAKLFAFSLGAGIAAIGGMVLAFQLPTLVYSSSYDYSLSINALVYAVIGGLGFLAGPVISAASVAPGGIAYQLLDFLRQGHDETLTLIGGIGMILVLWSAPDGMAKQMSDQLTAVGRVLRARLPLRLSRLSAAPGDGTSIPVRGARPSAPAATTSGQTAERVPPQSLSIKDLAVSFGGVRALDGVSVDLHPGEILGLIGPNGAGKTTLIDAITGFVNVSRGRIELNGRRLEGMSVAKRSRCGVQRSFQNLELFEDLTVYENLQVACDPQGTGRYITDLILPRKSLLSARAKQIVSLFDLEKDLTRKVRELPYGRRRLCAIARAAAATASVLLLDEPAAGLGGAEVAEVSRLVTELAKQHGVAVLLIEHNIDLIMELCDRVVVLDFGKQIAHGTPTQVRSDPRVLEAYMGEEVKDGAPAPASMDLNVTAVGEGEAR
jgi:ABC-type branched-subunit amino acid transport system ATPase component/branched-subunit amino acid ABC-type transport system permease component